MLQCIILLISAYQGFLHSQSLARSPTSHCRQIRLSEFSFPTLSRLLNENYFLGLNRPEHGLLEPSDMPQLCLPTAANAVAYPCCRSALKAPQVLRLRVNELNLCPLAQS